MFVRLVMLGSGTQLDPYRVPLPTYNMVEQDIPNMTAIVEVPDRRGPPDVPAPGSPLWQTINGRRVLVGMPAGFVISWWAMLARDYEKGGRLYQPAVK